MLHYSRSHSALINVLNFHFIFIYVIMVMFAFFQPKFVPVPKQVDLQSINCSSLQPNQKMEFSIGIYLPPEGLPPSCIWLLRYGQQPNQKIQFSMELNESLIFQR